MYEQIIYGLIGLLAIALLGIGLKITLSVKNKSRDKTVMKNINAGGDVVGRDKIVYPVSGNWTV